MSMCYVLFEFDLFVDCSELELCLEDSAVSEFIIIIIIIVIIIIYLKFYGSLDINLLIDFGNINLYIIIILIIIIIIIIIGLKFYGSFDINLPTDFGNINLYFILIIIIVCLKFFMVRLTSASRLISVA